MMGRRPFAIALLHFGKRPDEPVEIPRVELVGIACQRCSIADAVVACAALEEVAKGESRESGVAAGAAAADNDAFCVHQSAFRQEFGAVHAIVYVYDTPAEFKPVAVFASKSGTAAIVDVEHRNAAAGRELAPEIACARRRGGWAAVTFDQQGGAFVRASDIIRIVRRIE